MSKNIQFYKSKIFADRKTESFSHENVYSSIKELFKDKPSIAEEMIGQYFENLNLENIDINDDEIKKKIPNFNKELKFIFDENAAPFSMVDNKVWSAIQNIIYAKLKEELEEDNTSEIATKLDIISKISAEYDLLLNLYNAKLLFLNVF